MSKELLFKEECYQLVGMAMKVHSTLGAGFREIIYKDALEIEFKKNNILYEREKPFKIEYDGIILPRRFDADFFVFDSIIVEVKAIHQFHPDNFSQTLNYLKAAQVKLGVLINFGEPKLQFKRVICTY